MRMIKNCKKLFKLFIISYDKTELVIKSSKTLFKTKIFKNVFKFLKNSKN